MSDLQADIVLVEQLNSPIREIREATTRVVEAARLVANAKPMYRMGGLSEAWYLMDPDDTDELPDGWLLVHQGDTG